MGLVEDDGLVEEDDDVLLIACFDVDLLLSTLLVYEEYDLHPSRCQLLEFLEVKSSSLWTAACLAW